MADGADKARAGGFPLGPLHGLPIAYKDLCDIAGRIGTGGSKMFEKRVATETSNTVERLTAAGMVPLGKLHMVEFAFGGWGTNPLMGAPWNPWDLADASRARRLVERHRCRRRRAAHAGRHRQRHRRLGAHPLGVQRPGRPESHVRPHRAFGHHAAELDARFDRPDGAQRRGLRPPPQCAGRPRRARSDDVRPAARRFHRGDQARLDRRHAHRDARHQAASRLHACRRDQGLAVGRPDLRKPRRHRRSRAPARLVLRPVAAGRHDHRVGGLCAAPRLHRGHRQGDRPRRARPRPGRQELRSGLLSRGDADPRAEAALLQRLVLRPTTRS